MIEVQDFIRQYQTNPKKECEWLQKNTTSLRFNSRQDLFDLIHFFEEKQIQGGSKGPLLMKVVSDNAEKIIALFENVEQFEALFNDNSTYWARRILLKNATPLLQTMQSLEQLFRLIKQPEWLLAIMNNQDALIKISLLFKTWEDILTYADDIRRLPDLLKSNPKHFASLFTSSEQIIEIYNKNVLLASSLVPTLGTEIAPLYSTSAQLQPLAQMNLEVAQAIAKERNISILTKDNYSNPQVYPQSNIAQKYPQTGKKQAAPTPRSNISLQILGGFIAVVGIAAMALSFTLLPLSLGCFALIGIGAVATLIGIGIFSAGSGKSKPEIPTQAFSPAP